MKRFLRLSALVLLIAVLEQGAAAQDAAKGEAPKAPETAQVQTITTAEQFFAQVAERYAKIEDYEGKIAIATGKSSMSGTIAFKAPAFLRIDFSQPEGQVISYDGAVLTVYIPEYSAILSQQVGDKPGSSSAKLVSSEGLKTMKRSYLVAYETSPDPEPLDAGGTETAMRLLLTRRSVAEGFKMISLFVSPDSLLIRRMIGTTLAGDVISFDFTSVRTNIGIPAARFAYDSPASANVYNNFLFKSEN